MNRAKNIMWGVVFILIGVIVGMNLLGITTFDLFFDGWWTLLIIVPSAIQLVTDKDKKTSLIFLIIGILILLDYQNLFDVSILWKLAVPVALVLVGVKTIMDNIKTTDKKDKAINTEVNNDFMDENSQN